MCLCVYVCAHVHGWGSIWQFWGVCACACVCVCVCACVFLVRSTCYLTASTTYSQPVGWWELIGWMKLSDAAEGHPVCLYLCVSVCFVCVCLHVYKGKVVSIYFFVTFNYLIFCVCVQEHTVDVLLSHCPRPASVCVCAQVSCVCMCLHVCWWQCPCRLHVKHNLCWAHSPLEGGL